MLDMFDNHFLPFVIFKEEDLLVLKVVKMFFNLNNYGLGKRTVLLRSALRYFLQYAQKIRLPRLVGADEQRKGRQRNRRLPDRAIVLYGNVGKQDGSRSDAVYRTR